MSGFYLCSLRGPCSTPPKVAVLKAQNVEVGQAQSHETRSSSRRSNFLDGKAAWVWRKIEDLGQTAGLGLSFRGVWVPLV